MIFRVKKFNPNKIFKNKSIAIVGPADSAFDCENGKYIESFDYIIRLNKALVTWNPNNEKFLGRRTDILLHNFHENLNSGGGGPINWNLFEKYGVQFLIQPRFDKAGWRATFNYFKKYLNARKIIYVLPLNYYNTIIQGFENHHPTRGFYALYLALMSPSPQIFITGFTFFKTPYAKGYRDNLLDMEANRIHILSQGLHDTDLEYNKFLRLLHKSTAKNIFIDNKLYDILKSDLTELPVNVKKVCKG